MNSSPHHLNAICLGAIIIVGGVAIGMRLMAPEVAADYVSNGFWLPGARYGLLLPLIACGFILASERPVALVAGLAVLATTLSFGLNWAETIFLADKELSLLILRYPVLATALGVTTGIALLLPLWARGWLAPVVYASCGLGLGLSVVLESPGDFYAGWFTWAGGIGGLAIVIVSLALVNCMRWLGAGSGLTVAGRILGSWLLAASLMLFALTVARERPPDSATAPATVSRGIDVAR